MSYDLYSLNLPPGTVLNGFGNMRRLNIGVGLQNGFPKPLWLNGPRRLDSLPDFGAGC